MRYLFSSSAEQGMNCFVAKIKNFELQAMKHETNKELQVKNDLQAGVRAIQNRI